MTRQILLVIFTMLCTLSGSLMFTSYMMEAREHVLQEERNYRSELARAASLSPRPAPGKLLLGDMTYYLTSAPRGMVQFKWLGYTDSSIGLYTVLGDFIGEEGILSIKHDDGTYSFYARTQNTRVAPTIIAR